LFLCAERCDLGVGSRGRAFFGDLKTAERHRRRVLMDPRLKAHGVHEMHDRGLLQVAALGHGLGHGDKLRRYGVLCSRQQGGIAGKDHGPKVAAGLQMLPKLAGHGILSRCTFNGI